MYIHNENQILISGYDNVDVFSYAFGSRYTKMWVCKITKTRKDGLSGTLCHQKPIIQIFMKIHGNKVSCEKLLNTLEEIQRQHQIQRCRRRRLNGKCQ